MPKKFEDLGLSFLYPDNWNTAEDQDSQAMMIESPDGAFLSVTRLEDIDAETSIEQARVAMEGEYEEVEQESISREIGDRRLVGVTQRFVYLDLIVTSHLLAFPGNRCTYLVQMQAEDRDMTRLQQVFDAMLISMCQSIPADA